MYDTIYIYSWCMHTSSYMYVIIHTWYIYRWCMHTSAYDNLCVCVPVRCEYQPDAGWYSPGLAGWVWPHSRHQIGGVQSCLPLQGRIEECRWDPHYCVRQARHLQGEAHEASLRCAHFSRRKKKTFVETAWWRWQRVDTGTREPPGGGAVCVCTLQKDPGSKVKRGYAEKNSSRTQEKNPGDPRQRSHGVCVCGYIDCCTGTVMHVLTLMSTCTHVYK